MKTATKERPILFGGEMVLAIMAGRKTQTRRVLTPQPAGPHNYGHWDWMVKGKWKGAVSEKDGTFNITCPYGVKGDRLYVRESGWIDREERFYAYHVSPQKAWDRDGGGIIVSNDGKREIIATLNKTWKRRPSIHMPRWASRINLEVTKVRLERVSAITLQDVRAEGVEIREFALFGADEQKRKFIGGIHFRHLWDSINAKRGFGWDVNPWVWIVEFKKMMRE